MSVDGRVAKRQKVSNGDAVKPRPRAGIFAPYRTIGLISPTNVPFTSVALGKTTFQITTCIGNSLQTYDIRKGLHLNFITRPQTPESITASVAWRDKVLAAWSSDSPDSARGVWIYKRGRKVAELELPVDHDEILSSFCVFGTWIVGLCESRALVWKAETGELYTELQGISPVSFSGCISALPTLLNKVLIGRQDGSAEIWNVSTGKLVYTILPPSTTYGKVTAIEPTPALDLAAIAYENGRIIIHDIRTDQPIIVLNAGGGVPVTSISFRTDGIGAGDDGQSAGAMATSSSVSGDVTIWDLNNGGKRAGVLRAAHSQPGMDTSGGISRIQFLPGQAILVSSGVDNSLKTWIFDETPFSPVPRILHQRSGHGADITKLQFIPTNSDGSEDTGKWLMSGSADRSLWAWSLRRDAQSAELSQGAVQSKARKQGLLSATYQDAYQDLKCPPITGIACSLNRDGGIGALPGKQPIWQNAKGKKLDAEASAMTGWESVLTAHEGDSKARTWFWGRRRAGRWAFPTSDGGNVSAVAMSPCGTFALIGSAKGSIDMFNMQSGQHRQHFPARLTPVQAKQLKADLNGVLEEETDGKRMFLRGKGRHTTTVVGIAVDEINKTVISAGSDGTVKFFDFKTGLLVHQIDWSHSTEISAVSLHRGANLAAFTCTDACIRVVDITTYKLIRELRVPRGVVLELVGLHLSNCIVTTDARWITASLGPLVMTWDLATGHLIDGLKLREHCTSLDISATGEYLATATAGSVGVEVWSNKSLFAYTPTRNIEDADLLDILHSSPLVPTASGETGNNSIEGTSDDEYDDEVDIGDALRGLTSEMLSLSVLPRSRWQNLLNLDLIRQRNKPIEPPKKPEKAPFFLPSLQSQQKTTLATTTNEEAQDLSTEQQRVAKRVDGQSNATTRLLATAADTADYTPFFEHLKQLNPSAADIEIRSLSVVNDELQTFVHALTWLARQRKDFELGQTWMTVFLRVHGDVARNDAELRQAIREWQTESTKESLRVHKLAEYCGGLVGYLRAARV